MNVIEFYVEFFGVDREGPFTQTELLRFTQKYYDEYAVLRLSKAIAREFNITEADMFSVSRKQDIVGARQMHALILSEYTRLSLEAIGRLIGGLDHATVIHSIKMAKNHIETEERWIRIYKKITDGIRNEQILIPGDYKSAKT